MGLDALYTGMGAVGGLQNLLAQRAKAAAAAEQQRQFNARMALDQQKLDSEDADRKAHEAETALSHRNAEEAKQITLAGLRPIGAPVSLGEYQKETNAGMPSGMYDIGFTGQAPNQMPNIRFQGKEADQQKHQAEADKLQAAKDKAAEDANKETDRKNNQESNRQLRLTLAAIAQSGQNNRQANQQDFMAAQNDQNRHLRRELQDNVLKLKQDADSLPPELRKPFQDEVNKRVSAGSFFGIGGPDENERLQIVADTLREFKAKAGKATPAAPTGVPQVGSTFNGGRVLRVTPVK